MAKPTIDFSKLRVLVVENHALMRRLLAEMLRGFGVHHIRDARNVPEALEQIYRETFDVVVLDFFLGDLDGADFARRVRRDEACRNREVPILLITGMPDHHKVMKVRDAGVNGMLAKPIAPKDLYLRLYAMLAYPRPFVVTRDYVGPVRRPVKQNAGARIAQARASGQPRTEIRRRMPPEHQLFEEQILS